MSFREFEYADGKSFKFWKIELQGNDVVTRYGRIGSEGQETRKDLGSSEKAKKEYDKLVSEKLRKGYMEKNAAVGEPTKSAGAKTSAKKEKAGAAAEPGGGESPSTTRDGGVREFEYADGKSFKFWKIELQGNDVVTRYGRIGSEGQETRKDLGSPEKAQNEYEKLVSEKVRKGYVEKTAAEPAKSAGAKTAKKEQGGAAAEAVGGELSPMLFSTTRTSDFQHLSNFIGERVTDFREGKPTKGKTVFRVGVSYDDEDEGEADFGNRFKAFLASDAAAAARGLIIGAYDLEGGSSGDLPYDEIVKSKDRLPNLKALFIGDILQEEAEISWINQSDVSGMLEAFPQLEMLRIRGATGLSISKPQHARLRALAIESGGLPATVVSQICRGKFPNLEYLELWLGTDNYGGDCRVNDLQPILKGKLFPKLKYLGLRNAEIADDIAAVIVKSPVVDQLETLDLSLGSLGDVGANALLQLESKTNLKRLDLHHHYISKPVQKKLKELPFPVDLADAKTVDESDEFSGRFISISE